MFEFIHQRLASTAALYFLVIAVWAYIRFFRKQGIDSSFWGALAIGEVLIILQALLGGYLWIIGLRPARTIHLLYGILVPILIPGAYAYTKGRDGRPEALVYGTAILIGVGLIIRATFTGQVALP